MTGRFNLDIREHAKKRGVFLYEVAEHLNISDPTFTRRLRHELDDKEKRKLISIIDTIAARRATG